jgi:DNA-binding NarL/FixJ family response regulator
MMVLLVDDHPLFREGLALLLRPLVDELTVVEAGTCEEAFAVLDEQEPPHLVLMDLALPGMNGIDGIAVLHERFPRVPLVALSSADDRDTVLRALDAGAMGFVPKSSTSAVMLGALRLILANGIYLPPSAFLAGPTGPALAPTVQAEVIAARPSGAGASLGLTARQEEVLQLILRGLPLKLIARELNLSLGTVKAHTSAVLRALNVTTRTQAVVVAGSMGLRTGSLFNSSGAALQNPKPGGLP